MEWGLICWKCTEHNVLQHLAKFTCFRQLRCRPGDFKIRVPPQFIFMLSSAEETDANRFTIHQLNQLTTQLL